MRVNVSWKFGKFSPIGESVSHFTHDVFTGKIREIDLTFSLVQRKVL